MAFEWQAKIGSNSAADWARLAVLSCSKSRHDILLTCLFLQFLHQISIKKHSQITMAASGNIVRKVLETNLNFRYQRVLNLKKLISKVIHLVPLFFLDFILIGT